MSAATCNRSARLVGIGAVAVAAVALGASNALADKPISAKRAEAARVLADLQALDDRLELAIEKYNLVRIRLASNARAQRVNRHHLGVGRRNLATAQRRIAAHLVYLYTKEEPDSLLTVILGASSLSDLIDRVDTARRVADQDRIVLEQVDRFNASVERQQAALRRERDAQSRLAAELASQRAAIESGLAERRQLLSSIKGEIARLQAEEAARQRELRRQAEARLAAARTARPTPPPTEPSDLGVAAVTPEGIAVAADTRHAHVVQIAMQYLGVPYRWGGASPETGFDCSGFVLYVYAQVGISLPHNAAMQYGYGVPVAREDLQPGDLVFFNQLGHNGIYIGGGQFIQAPRTGDVVKISSLSEPWYAAGYVGARRLP